MDSLNAHINESWNIDSAIFFSSPIWATVVSNSYWEVYIEYPDPPLN